MELKFFKILAFFVSLLFFGFQGVVFPENFRVRKVHFVQIEEDSSFEKTVVTGINDSICVNLPESREFIEGIEVKVQIPSSVSSWHDSVAFSLYDNITPRPKSSQIDYSGTRIFLKPLPSKVYWIAQIPLFKETSLKDSAYTAKINAVPDTKDGFSFVRFMPVMKGVPEETLNAELAVTVKPCLVNKGRITLFLERTDGVKENALDIIIDDEVSLAQTFDEKYSAVLEPGLHNINIRSEDYRNEVRSVIVEQAKNTEVKISMKSLAPRLSVSAPDKVEIFLDGNKVSDFGKEFEISEGEHRISFVLGSYEVIRNINAEKGKTYSANLNVDLQILEE